MAKTSDFTNWIIALANITMAFAAIAAWRSARKYLATFFAQEGYRLAIEFINQNIIYLGVKNRYMVITGNALVILSQLGGKSHTEKINLSLSML
ncbi:hypothetical protein KGP26_29205 (plasmid) [Serratia sp. JSRIV002]|uniref:hypothetical protein n=1 Tax=Serratia sp. JSRIV002 TaxID=2831894 RepID=UPI001CBE7F32|nr:hypothetical protein [Serratia sp. JSRIV002]UAN54648.1 hypothetical protein KGP26_29205 [Serratia sp. JSRIV002]